MKHRNIILALLAVLTLAAQTAVGQIRTDNDLCLRDEQTGEWLMGLFKDFAVYDCEYWEYLSSVAGNMTLRNGNRTLKVRMKGKDGNVKSVSINGRKHKTSVVKSEFLPDYPTADHSTFADTGFSSDTVTIRGYMARQKQQTTIDCYVHHPLGASVQKFTVSIDKTGRFELRIPLMNTSEVFMWHSSWVLQPGETYFFYADYDKNQAMVMGRDARLQNELLQNGDSIGFAFDLEKYKDQDDATCLRDCRKAYTDANVRIGNLMKKHPLLSDKFEVYALSRNAYDAARELVQRWFVAANIRKDDGAIWNYLKTEILPLTSRPYTIVGDFGYVADRYIDGLMQKRSRFNHDYIEAALDAITDWQQTGRIHQSEAYMDSIGRLVKTMGEYRTLEESHTDAQTLANHEFPRLLQASAHDPLLMEAMRTECPERVLMKRLTRLEQLDIPSDFAELSEARAVYNLMEQNRQELPDRIKDFVQSSIHNEYYQSAIMERNDFYHQLALQTIADEEASLMSNEPLAGLTDGKEIFDRIIAPYRNHIIYVDVWGTWCGPCKYNLQYCTKPIKEALSDLPVVYLYLCNESSDASWRNVIKEYGLAGKNCIHYNLPLEQETAVEQYLDIHKYPTYILFDRQGQRVNCEEPRPYDTKKVRQIIEGIK